MIITNVLILFEVGVYTTDRVYTAVYESMCVFAVAEQGGRTNHTHEPNNINN